MKLTKLILLEDALYTTINTYTIVYTATEEYVHKINVFFTI